MEDTVSLKKQDVDWIQLANNRAQWLALQNTVINARVPHNARNSQAGTAGNILFLAVSS
jgi:hypothetical protein